MSSHCRCTVVLKLGAVVSLKKKKKTNKLFFHRHFIFASGCNSETLNFRQKKRWYPLSQYHNKHHFKVITSSGYFLLMLVYEIWCSTTVFLYVLASEIVFSVVSGPAHCLLVYLSTFQHNIPTVIISPSDWWTKCLTHSFGDPRHCLQVIQSIVCHSKCWNKCWNTFFILERELDGVMPFWVVSTHLIQFEITCWHAEHLYLHHLESLSWKPII